MIDQSSNAPAWLDCNASGRPHAFQPSMRVGSSHHWQCSRCPVGTLTKREAPPDPDPWLGKGSS